MNAIGSSLHTIMMLGINSIEQENDYKEVKSPMNLQSNRILQPVIVFMAALAIVLLTPSLAAAGEANLVIPELSAAQNSLLYTGILVCVLGMFFGYYQFTRVTKL
ncbi:MAG: hypothetical protein ABRQ24_03020, partial [Syntrophomonadaceae bacterium]